MLENLDKYLEELKTKFGGDIPQIIQNLQGELDKGKQILTIFNDSLNGLFTTNTVLTNKQKDDFFNLFQDKYDEVTVASENFFGVQEELRKQANARELLLINTQNTTITNNMNTNLKSLANIYKVVWDNIMKGINLTEKQRKDLAAEIAHMRFGERAKTPENLLTLRRYEDNWQPSLYNTFNVIQENMIKGGQTVTDRVMRPITNIDTDVNLNRNMWSIAYNTMKQLHAA